MLTSSTGWKVQPRAQSACEGRTAGLPKQKRNRQHCPGSLTCGLQLLFIFLSSCLGGKNLLSLFIFSVQQLLTPKLQSFRQSGSRRKNYQISCWNLQSVISRTYLNDVTEHKDIKPGQVLNMVLLNHLDVSSNQSPDLLQQEEELCNAPVKIRTRIDINKTMKEDTQPYKAGIEMLRII